MSIVNYGLFWQREEVTWHPGTGGRYRLLGRNGVNKPGLRIADFREQSGVYILYGNYGVYYVGIVTGARLGFRLRDHNDNDRYGEWDRFSWYGFRSIDKRPNEEGICELGHILALDANGWIRDIEALLIRAMGPRGQNVMNFTYEERWEQIPEVNAEYYLGRTRPDGED